MDTQRLTEADFAKAVGLSQDTIYRLRKAGRIPYLKIGRLIRYLPAHVEQFNSHFERQPKVASISSPAGARRA